MKRATINVLTALAFASASLYADASCVCRCVSGDVRAICTSSLEVPPICAPQVCPITPPAVAPIETPRVPPVGTKTCKQEQVLNPYTNKYEWKTICR